MPKTRAGKDSAPSPSGEAGDDDSAAATSTNVPVAVVDPEPATAAETVNDANAATADGGPEVAVAEVAVADADPADDTDEYHLLGPNTPLPPGKSARKCTSSVFKRGYAMRLLPGHFARENGYTHKCTYPLDPEEVKPGYTICGKLIKCGYNSILKRWVSTRFTKHAVDCHPASGIGVSTAKRQKTSSNIKEEQMFQAGLSTPEPNPRADAKWSPKADANSEKYRSVGEHFKLPSKVEDLTSAARYYVYGRQRISKQTFDDPFFQAALQGSNKSRPLLTREMLEKYVKAEFALFEVFI